MPEVNLTGPQKAALLVVSLGVDSAVDIFKYLSEDEIEQLTIEIAELPRIGTEERNQVIMEFREKLITQQIIAQGGSDYAKEILQRVYGPERSQEIVNRLLAHFGMKPFETIRRADPTQILELIQNEHPQTISLVLSYLPPLKAADVIARMDPDLQRDVVKRMATMARTNPEVIRHVDRVLREKVSSLSGEEMGPIGGVDTVVRVLQMSDRTTEKAVIEALAEEDTELAETIKKKMFVFRDVLILDDRSMQKVLREVEISDLALALKGAEEKIKEKVINNLPKRAAAMLSDEISFLGPVRAADVEEAQQKVINIIRQMEESGDVIISRGGRGAEAVIE